MSIESFPNGARFAFSIIDDTDESTTENVKPIYDLLCDLGIRTTKTVWVLPTNNPKLRPNEGETLSNPDYLAFIRGLQDKGFEIAFHGARGGDSTRQEIIESLDKFRELIGYYPNIHINHCFNKDNLYWGVEKLNSLPLRLFYRLTSDNRRYYGHVPGSDFFWGDIAQERIKYSVNFSFHKINLLAVTPNMPYFDPKKPFVNAWFHTSDGGSQDSFNKLLSKENLDRLERERGVCLVYTHFGKGFCLNGEVNQATKERLQELASRNGWFVPANEILDFLSQGNSEHRRLSYVRRLFLELRWMFEKLVHGPS